MTPAPETVAPDTSLQAAAALMDELNVGVLPVVEDGRLLGVVTDRDITVRATAAGADPADSFVSEAMSANPRTVGPDDEIEAVEQVMADAQVRRVPVVDAEGRLVGILSLGDLAEADTSGAEAALEAVSTPAAPDR